jgi:phosphoglycolate phosphatase
VTPDPTLDGRLLFWGLHGTLADSFAAIQAAADQALYAHGYPPGDEERLRASIGLSPRRIFRRLVDGADKPTVDALVATYRVAFGPASRTYTTLFPGIDALLKDLAALDAWPIVATCESCASVESLLEWLGIAGCLGKVITADDVTNTKPHPEMVWAGCRAQGRDPARALVIGGTVFDIEMGQRAGAQTCGVTWGNQPREQLAARRPTWLVDTLDELRQVLARELGG